MAVRSYTIQGIVLKRHNVGEADRVITLFTKHGGKLRVLGKGIRKITSRRSGSLEIFNQVRAHIVHGKKMEILTEVELVKSFQPIKSDLQTTTRAYELIELVDKLTAEGVENQEVYFLLTNALSELSASEKKFGNQIVSNFAIGLLRSLGFWPRQKEFAVDWKSFIESILERPLKSPKILTRISKDLE